MQWFYGSGDDDPDWQGGEEDGAGEADGDGEEENTDHLHGADDGSDGQAVGCYSPMEPHIWLYREAIIISKSRPLESSACPSNCVRRGIESAFDLTQHLRVVHADSSNHYGAKRILGNPDPEPQDRLEAYLFRNFVWYCKEHGRFNNTGSFKVRKTSGVALHRYQTCSHCGP